MHKIKEESISLKPMERVKLIEKISCELQSAMSTGDINIFLYEYDLEFESANVASSKRIYVREILSKVSNEIIIKIGCDLELYDKGLKSVILEEIYNINNDYIESQINKCNDKIKRNDFDGAITNSRTLIESVCMHILDELDISYEKDGNLIKLYKLVSKALEMTPGKFEDESLKQICSGFFSIVNGLSGLRNSMSDAHGNGQIIVYRADLRHALLATNSAKTISDFLLMSLNK